jgi:hypothetical protein
MAFEMEEPMSTAELKLTQHAVTRFAQRGFRDGDAELIMAIGTEVEGGYLVRQRDVRDFEQRMKRLLDRVYRSAGKRLVVEGDVVVTGYHSRHGKERKLMKKL